MLAAFTITIFTSAFLLFLVQPMFARMILPLLGGAPAVWNTALVFYQATLLAGYAYAHATTRWLGARSQSVLHLILMALAVLALPIHVLQNWRPPAEANPVFWLLGLLALSVGLPFFVVSAGSPLLQKWFASTGHEYSSDPYFLYAASNLGSMLALLSYPVLAEPLMSLQQQSWLWTAGYGALMLLMTTCGVFLWTSNRGKKGAAADSVSSPELDTGTSWAIRAEEGAPSLREPSTGDRLVAARYYSKTRRRLRWLVLALVPSSLMMSVTNYLTSDIAAVPLLWVIPLVIYLSSFILVFARRPPVPHVWMIKAMPILVLPLAIVLNIHGTDPITVVLPLHLAAFFVIAMVCHGELVRDRPPAHRLTEFYLFISMGGVIGGALNALLAPLVFKSFAEYPIVVMLACLSLPWVADRPNLRARFVDFMLPAALGVMTLGLVLASQKMGIQTGPLAVALMFGLPALIAFSFSRRPIRFGLAVGAILLAGTYYDGNRARVLYSERSFFGVTRVTEDASRRYHQILHGGTLHGGQWIEPARSREPIAYYSRTGPLGQFFEALAEPGVLRHVAVVGLGAGTISCYAAPGQEWTYFEIDPIVVQCARDPRFFTYLRNCPADLKVVLGDGRLSLASVPDAAFDVLVLDAYNSDSLPVHLLTREAVQLYLRKLAPKGVLVFHISNRYLDLEPILGSLAREAGVYCLVRSDLAISQTEIDLGKASSRYLIMMRNKTDLRSISSDERWKPPRTGDNAGIWTDDYSSILRILRWHR